MDVFEALKGTDYLIFSSGLLLFVFLFFFCLFFVFVFLIAHNPRQNITIWMWLIIVKISRRTLFSSSMWLEKRTRYLHV